MTRLIPVIVAALSVPAITFAQQGGPTVYGIVDAGVRHTSGLTAANAPAPASATGLASGVNNTSRIGFRSREDLGDGMYALFNLETGLNVDTGSTANATKFFDRAAIVGIGDSWGQVTLGRQTNLLADAVSPVDAVGMRFAAFNPNIVTAALSNHGLGVEYGATGSSSGSYRLDNSFKYTGSFGPVTARAMYSLGENAGSTATQHSAGAGLAYAAGGWVISGAYQRFTTAADLPLRATTLGVAYQFGSVRLAVNTARSHAQMSPAARTEQRTHSAGATWSATNTIDLTAAWYRVERERTGARDDGYSRTMLFAEYKFSRRTKLYAELDRTHWYAGYQGATAKNRATGISSGIVHTF